MCIGLKTAFLVSWSCAAVLALRYIETLSRQRLILSQLSSIIIMLQRCVISLRHRIVSYDSCVEQQQYNFLTCNYHYCEYHKQHLHYWHSVTATYSQYWSWSQRVLPWSPLHYLIHIFYSTKSS